MKKGHTRICAALLSLVMCLSMAGCGSSEKTEEDELKEAYNELDESDKKELDELKEEIEKEEKETETTTTTTAQTTTAPTTTTAETTTTAAPLEPIDDPQYYAYYEDLKNSYLEAHKCGGRGRILDPILIDGKIYIYYAEVLDLAGKPEGTAIYSYDIESKKVELVAKGEITLEDGEYKTSKAISSWFKKGDDLYVMYAKPITQGLYDRKQVHIEKIGKGGKKKSSGEELVYNLYENDFLRYVCDNGKVISEFYGGGIYVYEPDLSKYTYYETISVPGEHGMNTDLNKPEFQSASGNCIYFSELAGNDIYELNTETNEVRQIFKDIQKDFINVFGDYVLVSKNGEVNKDIYKMSDESLVSAGNNGIYYEGVFRIGSDGKFFCGDGYYKKTYEKKWVKVSVPDANYSEVTGDKNPEDTALKNAKEVSDETKEDQYIFAGDFEHYIVADEYGYFLRSYEKGESEEETIITKEQIIKDLSPKQ